MRAVTGVLSSFTGSVARGQNLVNNFEIERNMAVVKFVAKISQSLPSLYPVSPVVLMVQSPGTLQC